MALVAMLYGDLSESMARSLIAADFLCGAAGLIGAVVFLLELAVRDFRLVRFKAATFLAYVAELLGILDLCASHLTETTARHT
jgi:hypothetical protein